jgi:hypothetical protein
MAFFVPVLLLILLGIIDFSRAIHFDNILIHVSREGANLAARTPRQPQDIISALSQTAQPLKISTSGMIFITRAVGQADGSARVSKHYRAASGDSSLNSRLFTCGAWDGNNECQIPDGAGPIIDLGTPLAENEIVNIVETEYNMELVTGFIFDARPELYSKTIL